MNIMEFKEKLKEYNPENPNIPIGYIIDLLGNEYDQHWMFVLKAFVVSFSKNYIPRSYFMEKLEYCINSKGREHEFLDVFRRNILSALMKVNQKGYGY